MDLLRPTLAPFAGLKLCFFDASVRRLAKWPFVIGAASYIASMYTAYKVHAPATAWLAGAPNGFWSTVLYWLAWLFTGALLLVATFFLTIIFVMLFTSVFQAAIAQAVMRNRHGELAFPEISLAAETARTIIVTAKKLLWLGPLLFFVILIGFIPVLAPLALLFGAWLLAYQFADVVLDLFHVGAGRRLTFARRNFLPLAVFGAVLATAWAVPFLGIFLAPAATAGAAWLLADEKFLNQIRLLAPPPSSKQSASPSGT